VTRVRILVHMRQGRQRLCDDAADNLAGGEEAGSVAEDSGERMRRARRRGHGRGGSVGVGWEPNRRKMVK
jgi:hypothetical protein